MDKFTEGQSRLDKSICFDCSKREIFTPWQGLKALRRKLQNAFKISACVAPRERPAPRVHYRCHPPAVAPVAPTLADPHPAGCPTR